MRLILMAVTAALLINGLALAGTPDEHTSPAPPPPPPTQTVQTAPGALTPDQVALYWHAKYMVAMQQIEAAADRENSCPTYLQAAAQGLMPQQQPAPAARQAATPQQLEALRHSATATTTPTPPK